MAKSAEELADIIVEKKLRQENSRKEIKTRK